MLFLSNITEVIPLSLRLYLEPLEIIRRKKKNTKKTDFLIFDFTVKNIKENGALTILVDSMNCSLINSDL